MCAKSLRCEKDWDSEAMGQVLSVARAQPGEVGEEIKQGWIIMSPG